jgi:hypothetical protein
MPAQKTITQKPTKITLATQRSRPVGPPITSAKLIERRNKVIISRMKKEK